MKLNPLYAKLEYFGEQAIHLFFMSYAIQSFTNLAITALLNNYIMLSREYLQLHLSVTLL